MTAWLKKLWVNGSRPAAVMVTALVYGGAPDSWELSFWGLVGYFIIYTTCTFLLFQLPFMDANRDKSLADCLAVCSATTVSLVLSILTEKNTWVDDLIGPLFIWFFLCLSLAWVLIRHLPDLLNILKPHWVTIHAMVIFGLLGYFFLALGLSNGGNAEARRTLFESGSLWHWLSISPFMAGYFLAVSLFIAVAWSLIRLHVVLGVLVKRVSAFYYLAGWFLLFAMVSLVMPVPPGFYRLQPDGGWQPIVLPPELKNQKLEYAYTAANGDRWVSTANALAWWRDESWTVFHVRPIEDDGGQVYLLSTIDGPIAEFDGSLVPLVVENLIPGVGGLWTMVDDNSEAFYKDMAVAGFGIFRLAANQPDKRGGLNSQQSLLFILDLKGMSAKESQQVSEEPKWSEVDSNHPSRQISDLLIDTDGAIWVLTFHGAFKRDSDGKCSLIPDVGSYEITTFRNGLPGQKGPAERSAFRVVGDRQETWFSQETEYTPAFGTNRAWLIGANGHILTLDSEDQWQDFDHLGLLSLNKPVVLMDQGNDDLIIFFDTVLGARPWWIMVGALAIILVTVPVVLSLRLALKWAPVYRVLAVLKKRPDLAIAQLRQLRVTAPEMARFLGFAFAVKPDRNEPWRNLARTYLALALKRPYNPAALLGRLRAQLREYPSPHAAPMDGLYEWFETAYGASDTRTIAKLMEATKHVALMGYKEVDPSNDPREAFTPVEPWLAAWFSKNALGICRFLRDYEHESTVERKLILLGEVNMLLGERPESKDLNGLLRPELHLAQLLVARWKPIVESEIERVRGPVTLRVSLATRTIPRAEELAIPIQIENIGQVAAEILELKLEDRGDFESLHQVLPSDHGLSPSQAIRIIHTVRPTNLDFLRISFTLAYKNSLNGTEDSLQFGDVVSLIDEEVDFQPIANPYIPGMPIEIRSRNIFFGRTDLLAWARDNLQGATQHNVLVLHGQRRLGKTSILKQLPRVLDTRYYLSAFFDMQGFNPSSDTAFLYDLAEEIAFQLEGAGLNPPPLEFHEFQESASGGFNRFIRSCKKVLAGKLMVLMIDEFDQLEIKVREGGLSSSIYELIRHHMQHSHHLAFIIAGTERLLELSREYWSILFNTALFKEVGFLDESATRTLITEPTKGALTMDEPVVDKIVDITSCHPLYVQVICQHLVHHMNQVKRSVVTLNDVETVLQKSIQGADAQISFIYRDQATEEEQLVMSTMSTAIGETGGKVGIQKLQALLAEHGLQRDEDWLLKRLDRLVDKKVILKTYLRGHYFNFTVDLVRLWTAQNQPLERLAKK